MGPSLRRLHDPANKSCHRAPSHVVFLSLAGLISFTSLALFQHSPSSPHKEIFTDVTEQARIAWRHFSGESPDRFLIETMGGGVAFLDFDSDGFEDLFFVNGGETPHGKRPVSGRNAVYHNFANGEFFEVSRKTGGGGLTFFGV